MNPDIRRAFEASWHQNREAYEYLARIDVSPRQEPRMDDTMTKPPDCTCGFPKILARNGCGHANSCPAYSRWLEAAFGKLKGSPEPTKASDDFGVLMDSPSPSSPPDESKPTPAIEDRGTAAWIFESRDERSFCPFDGYVRRNEISVPIGWSLIPHPTGVLLRNVSGDMLTAWRVLSLAVDGQRGFRVRSVWPPQAD